MRSVGDGISKAECCASVELGKIFSIRQVRKFAILEISGRETKCGTLNIDIFLAKFGINGSSELLA